MPRKLRRPKRRINSDEEYEAWAIMFMSGFDYLNDLDVFGFKSKDEKREAAREAWQRFGARFMEHFVPYDWRPLPWAHEEFGEPPCR
jgi:hypothetical protein